MCVKTMNALFLDIGRGPAVRSAGITVTERMGKMAQKAYLLLENGRYFEGVNFGAPVTDHTGELVFTTGVEGYIETLTDPSYSGQIVVQTFPLIGNYGIIPEDFESSRVWMTAYVVKEWCQEPSNYRCAGDLDTFLKAQNIPGISGVDTRTLTKIIREAGSMNAMITSRKPPYTPAEVEALREYRVTGAVERVSPKKMETFPAEGERKYRVALWDFGAKTNIRRELQKRGCEVIDMPAGTKAEEIAALQADGLMLTNGPGDPSDNADIIREIRKTVDTGIPTFGICLGHQLMALAMGGKTGKMKFGHRGGNQPVKDLKTGRVYISSQNHGYEVLGDTLPDTARVSFINVNDGTCEGVDYLDRPAFTVQFHPEACSGPHDTRFMFGRFADMMDKHKSGKEDA